MPATSAHPDVSRLLGVPITLRRPGGFAHGGRELLIGRVALAGRYGGRFPYLELHGHTGLQIFLQPTDIITRSPARPHRNRVGSATWCAFCATWIEQPAPAFDEQHAHEELHHIRLTASTRPLVSPRLMHGTLPVITEAARAILADRGDLDTCELVTCSCVRAEL